MMSIIKRWMARLGITGLYVGWSVPHCPSGSLVVFPYEPQKIEELFGGSAEKVSERLLAYLFRFFTVSVPDAVREEILAPDPRYPQRRYGYQEMFELLDTQGALVHRNPTQPLMQLHAGEAAAVALALEESWWLLVNEQRALTLARQRNLKAVTVPEFIVYLYPSQLLSARSAQAKLDGIAANTGQRVMRAARDECEALARSRGER